MKKTEPLQALAAGMGMGLLILFQKRAVTAAADGVRICLETVIPSLFPFLVLTGILNQALRNQKGLILLPGSWYGMPRNSRFLWIPALLGGYPLGAAAIAEQNRQGQISRTEAGRLLQFGSNAGPAFLFGIVQTAFDGHWQVPFLWMTQLLSAWLVSRLGFAEEPPKRGSLPQPASLPVVVERSVQTMGKICGWIVLFRILQEGLLLLLRGMPQTLRVCAVGILELSNGCLLLKTISQESLRLIAAAGMLAFGGLCVMLQTASVIVPLDLRQYVWGKVLQSIFAVCISAGFVLHWPLLLIPAGFLMFAESFRTKGRNLQRRVV